MEEIKNKIKPIIEDNCPISYEINFDNQSHFDGFMSQQDAEKFADMLKKLNPNFQNSSYKCVKMYWDIGRPYYINIEETLKTHTFIYYKDEDILWPY
jgi:hypothetical protein